MAKATGPPMGNDASISQVTRCAPTGGRETTLTGSELVVKGELLRAKSKERKSGSRDAHSSRPTSRQNTTHAHQVWARWETLGRVSPIEAKPTNGL